MKRTYNREKDLNEPSFDLNKSSTGCAPCLRKAKKIDKKMKTRSFNKITINEIKEIINSILKEKDEKK